MKILRSLLNRSKKSAVEDDEDIDDLPSMHTAGQLSDSDRRNNTHSSAKNKHQHEDAHEDSADENIGLPSVNRRSSSIVNMVGLGIILLIGMIALFSVGNNTRFTPETKKTKAEIASNLPPLELPAPTPPAPIKPAPTAQVPPIQNSQPIPLQNDGQPQLEWHDRKLTGGLLLGNQNGQTPPQEPRAIKDLASAKEELSKTISQANADKGVDIAEIAKSLTQKPETPKEDLTERLKPTITKGVAAELLPNRNFVIAKGTALDCALETAIDTTVPGLLTCRLTRDVYSDNGHVVMLDRGSQLVGEYQSGIKDGQARVFVLWTRAKTPNGVVVALDSPGTDALGRAGIEGWVDHHYAERFGAAILTSIIKDVFATIAYTAAQNNRNGTYVSIGNTSKESEQMGVEILKHSARIPPTLYVNQGTHIQVMVARDLDFTSVYGLELKK